MPTTATLVVFQYDELTPAAQRRVRNHIENHDIPEFYNDFWTQDVKEQFHDELVKLNYPADDVEFSLGHCQGDGMAFYGRVEARDFPAIAKRLWGAKDGRYRTIRHYVNFLCECGLSLDITKNSYGYHYSHYNTMDVALNEDYTWEDLDKKPALRKALNDLEAAVQEDVRDVSRRLEAAGYEIYEYDEDFVLTLAREGSDGEGQLYFSNGDHFNPDTYGATFQVAGQGQTPSPVGGGLLAYSKEERSHFGFAPT